MRLLLVALLTLLASPFAPAEPRAVEVFGQAGAMRLGADEGTLGTGLSLGGTVTLPFARRWALDVSARTARPEDFESGRNYFSIRRTLILPAVVYRRGSERLLGFVGGGTGVQTDRTRSRYLAYSGDPTQPDRLVLVESNGRETGVVPLIGRTGFVANPAGQLLIRADVELAFRYALPNLTGQIGVGWRF